MNDPPPENPALRVILDVAREGENARVQRALHQALAWSMVLVPAKLADDGRDPNEDGYSITFPSDPETGQPVLAAFSDQEALLGWTGGERIGCVAMTGRALLRTVLEHDFAALVLNPDPSGAVRLPREVLETLARSAEDPPGMRSESSEEP